MPKLLLITVLEKVCLDTVVREVSGVSNCHFPREGTEAYQKVVENGIVVNDAVSIARYCRTLQPQRKFLFLSLGHRC
jgi:hypothetical protein